MNKTIPVTTSPNISACSRCMHVHNLNPSVVVVFYFPPSADTPVTVEEVTVAALESFVPVALEE